MEQIEYFFKEMRQVKGHNISIDRLCFDSVDLLWISSDISTCRWEYQSGIT